MTKVAVKLGGDSTRSEFAEAMTRLAIEARNEARRGYVGVNGPRYARIHGALDQLLFAWQLAPFERGMGRD